LCESGQHPGDLPDAFEHGLAGIPTFFLSASCVRVYRALKHEELSGD
jgi:hypothetical protein